MLNMVLFYAKYSMDLTDGIEDDLTDSFKDIQGIIDKAMKSYHAPDRMKQVNIVFDKIVKFIDAEIGKESEEKPDSEMPDSKESEEESKADISSADGSATDDEKEKEPESVESSTSGSADDSADPEDTEKDSGDEKKQINHPRVAQLTILPIQRIQKKILMMLKVGNYPKRWKRL